MKKRTKQAIWKFLVIVVGVAMIFGMALPFFQGF